MSQVLIVAVNCIEYILTLYLSLFSCCSTAGDKNPETYDFSLLQEATRNMIEADSFWCLQKLLEGIQV